MAGVQAPTVNASGIQPHRNSSKLTDLVAGSPRWLDALSGDNDLPRLRRHWLPHVSRAVTAQAHCFSDADRVTCVLSNIFRHESGPGTRVTMYTHP